MPERDLPADEVLRLLAQAPAQLADVAAAVSPERLHTSPAPGEWSAAEVLAHLRACAVVWGAAMRSILDGVESLRAVNPTTWITRTDYRDVDFASALAVFTDQRRDLLGLLTPLPEADWSRSAEVIGAGRPRQRTVRHYAQRLATHERPHLRQIARAAAG